MKEPIVLGLDADATDVELEQRAAEIKGRLEAFVKAIAQLSRQHNVWLSGWEEEPLLVDGATDERKAQLRWNEKRTYTLVADEELTKPIKYRQGRLVWLAERRAKEEQWERERQERIAEERRQAEHAERMKAAGYERIDFSQINYGTYPQGGTIYAVGTAGGWRNPTTGHVYTGGSPDPGEYKPEGGKP